jgi:RHS repeat-associated protein
MPAYARSRKPQTSPSSPTSTSPTSAAAPQATSTSTSFLGSERILTKKTTTGQQDQQHWFYLPDHVGSTDMVTSEVGQLVDHIPYFPFGEVWVEERPKSLPEEFFFTAKEFDPETGFYDFGARYLHPRFSKWMTADPADRISASAPIFTLNPYQYGLHNPARFFDPNGAAEFEVTTTRAPELQAWLDREAESGRWPSSGERLGKAVSLGMIAPQAAMDIIEESGPSTLDLRVKWGDISPKAALMELRGDFWGALREESPHIAFEAASTLLPELKSLTILKAAGGLVPKLTVAQEFDIVTYGTSTPGFVKHHGLMDVWAAANIAGYESRGRANPTIVLTREQHALQIKCLAIG